ncbi:phage tail sheath subtilisin-like domain-containing protein [bacterium]|nr:phage tail sheath subtilisin-like domain-containing protein [bacterium]
MSERIVSPGVFTRERDLSFLPQGIASIGAAIIGPTIKGPAFVPTVVSNFAEFEEMFGSTDSRFYTPYAVEQYLRSAGTVTIVRVLNTGGYTADSIELYVSGSGIAKKTLAVLLPSRGGSDGTADLEGSTVGAGSDWNEATLTLSGSNWGAKSLTVQGAYTFSFDTGSANYIGDVFSVDPQVQKSGANTVGAYLYKNFKYAQSSNGYDATAAVTASHATLTSPTAYSNASTPYVQSQLINGARYNLFKVNTRSHGSDVNNKYKVVILSVKKAGSIAGSDFGTFSLQLRQTGLDDNGLTTDNILEQWDNLNFDPKSTNYFARRIGDRYVTIDSNGKLTYNGDWNNRSKHVYVSDFSDIADGSVPKTLSPMGHAAISNTSPGTTGVPAWTFKTTQSNAQGEFDSNVPYGHDYGNADADQYLASIPDSAGSGNHTTMSLEDFNGHDDASVTGDTYSSGSQNITLTLSSVKQRKFVVPFQGGFDGDNPANPKKVGSNIVAANTQGFDISSASATGAVAYKKAINAISNPDEFDINMLVTPGVIHNLHPKITNHAIAKCEERGDAFYVFDCGIQGGSISAATSAISALDTNYAATYYPWVKIVDRNTALPVWVPPSCVLPGTIAYTDKVAHEWFAPAGLNRGGLTTVLEAQTRLTHEERDTLYEDRVNPIASFPGQGVVVWGQKTLQGRPSALDRVNVRRLLIKLKKFIASSSRYLVFEQNTSATRNRFLNIVNPFLESVQSNSGLSAFKVIMGDSNNTPDVIDRNQLVGQIMIQPTRTAEFIVLDFTVLPTGATFPS